MAHAFWNRVHNDLQGHPRSLVFGTNRKRVCDFVLVANSNLGHIFVISVISWSYPSFRDVRAFVHRKLFFFDTPALFQPKFRRAVLGVDPWCWSMRERTLSYQTNRVTVMKNSSLCDHHTSTSRGQTHRRLAVAIPAKNTHGVSYSVTNKSDLSFINYLY